MADQNVPQLTEVTTPADTDLLYVTVDPDTIPLDRKIAVANLRTAMGGDNYGDVLFYDNFDRPNTTGGMGSPNTGPVWVPDTSELGTHEVQNGRGTSLGTGGTARSSFSIDPLPVPTANDGMSNFIRMDVRMFAYFENRIEFLRLDANNYYWCGLSPDTRRFKVFSVLDGVTTQLYDASAISSGAYGNMMFEFSVIVARVERFGNDRVHYGARTRGFHGLYAPGYSAEADLTKMVDFYPTTGNFAVVTRQETTLEEVKVTKGALL